MKRRILFCMATVLLLAARAGAQDSYNDRAQKYIQQYATLAILEQQKNGIPAAITLGQGILETEAGASELMTEANNHFGIKCGNHWDGFTFTHTDDAPNECFKKYGCAAESFRDHSEHLKKNPRYSPLFSLSETDYASWAVCLKKCGYATNPQYAQRLIKIIEDFKLQEYTYSAINNTSLVDYPSVPAAKTTINVKEESDEDAGKRADTIVETRPVDIDPIKRIADSARNFFAAQEEASAQQKADSLANAISNNYQNSKLVIVNGLKAFYAYKDEMLLQYAIKFNVRYPKLLEMNDLPDGPLAFNTYVYVEKKLASGTHTQHAVKEGENLLMISQAEGIQLKRLETLNLLKPGEEPASGSIIQLQFPARQRPALASNVTPPIKNPAPPARVEADVPVASTVPVKTTYSAPVVKPVAAAPVHQPVVAVKEDETNTEEEVDTTEAGEAAFVNAKAQDQVKLVMPAKGKVKNVPARVCSSAEAAAARISAKQDKFYTVKKGDTAFSIAKRNNILLDQLMQWNNLNDGGIQVGQTLRVKE